MKRTLLLLVLVVSSFVGTVAQDVKRPRLVVGLVLDQMRWDYLYRYHDRFAKDGGFRRLIEKGFSCENTLIPYAPTVTACGHSTLFSGAVPAVSGIVGNAWYDQLQKRNVYCTEDNSVATVGSTSSLGKQSPRNMFVNSIADELRLATNFRSKTLGISLKDRGGILMAGHSANAAYWYDNTNGNWITSTFYMNDLPTWVDQFNKKKRPDALYDKGWTLLYPAASYVQSTTDDKPYEAKPFGTAFPYDLKKFIGKDYGKIATTPAGNTLTFEFAMAAIEAEQMGGDAVTDILALSFSSPDYIGHTFGPNSIEAEDGFLRFDLELGRFLDFLDQKVGKDQFTLFLSADHGVAHVPEFLQENRIPAGRVKLGAMMDDMNRQLAAKYGMQRLILDDLNYQVHLDRNLVDSANLPYAEICRWISGYLQRQPGILRAFPLEELNTTPLPAVIRNVLNNGYHPLRSGDVQYILDPNFIEAYSTTGTTHGLWNPYDTHIPLLWYGWGIGQGQMNRETYMTDVAPTLAALLHIQMPNGSTGQVIQEIFGDRGR
jgi:predicted AlkP superfamily pyrophosphatase or phosphodiesterase